MSAIAPDLRHTEFADVLRGMVDHPQGHHGWATFFAALHIATRSPRSATSRLLLRCWEARPALSAAHLATLLGVAVKGLGPHDPRAVAVLDPATEAEQRAAHLDRLLVDRFDEVEPVLLGRHHSFTGARRFLLPQVLVGAFSAYRLDRVRFLDLGTGLGLLPRQLNQRPLFERFIVDLDWPGRPFDYRPIPFDCRHGVDRAPLPTLEWVRACHGPSDYYDRRFGELLECVSHVDASGVDVQLAELDLLDLPALASCLARGRYNAIVCSFVLYQHEPWMRRSIIATVLDGLTDPGIFISMEPQPELARSGCRIDVYLAPERDPLHFADVSDGHFMGRLDPGTDYGDVVRRLASADR